MGPIGVFDSGYGGLTVLRELVKTLPQYDYLYLGDNARTPYGTRSFETVYRYTLQCVKWLQEQGCPLIVLACNTASAKALRTIQQNDLPHMKPGSRVLGVIRPTTELVGSYSKSKAVGILATPGTVQSGTYPIEIGKFFPEVTVEQEACPMWVPLVENNEYQSAGADYFIKKHINGLLARNNKIDTLLLACTHYPLLKELILKYLPEGVRLVSQGEIVAHSLADYLTRHPEMEKVLKKAGLRTFYTTDDPLPFTEKASIFVGEPVKAMHTDLSC